jgi:hypothetical protein
MSHRNVRPAKKPDNRPARKGHLYYLPRITQKMIGSAGAAPAAEARHEPHTQTLDCETHTERPAQKACQAAANMIVNTIREARSPAFGLASSARSPD